MKSGNHGSKKSYKNYVSNLSRYPSPEVETDLRMKTLLIIYVFSKKYSSKVWGFVSVVEGAWHTQGPGYESLLFKLLP